MRSCLLFIHLGQGIQGSDLHDNRAAVSASLPCQCTVVWAAWLGCGYACGCQDHLHALLEAGTIQAWQASMLPHARRQKPGRPVHTAQAVPCSLRVLALQITEAGDGPELPLASPSVANWMLASLPPGNVSIIAYVRYADSATTSPLGLPAGELHASASQDQHGTDWTPWNAPGLCSPRDSMQRLSRLDQVWAVQAAEVQS